MKRSRVGKRKRWVGFTIAMFRVVGVVMLVLADCY